MLNGMWTQCERWTENDICIRNVPDLPLYNSLFPIEVREIRIFHNSE
jgi:hypothetical protein